MRLHRVAYPNEADAEEQGRELAELEEEYEDKEEQAGDELFLAIEANDVKKVDKICLNWFGDQEVLYKIFHYPIENIKGLTPTHFAASEGHIDCLRLLIASGADVNKPDNTVKNNTPAHIAASKGHVDCLRLLISNGADLNTHSSLDITPLQIACQFDNFGCVDVLLKAGAVDDEEGKASKYLVDHPLHLAIDMDNVERVRELLASGIDINKKSNQYEYTPTYIAAFEGHIDCLRLLIENGADVNIPNKYNYTPTHIAAEKGHVDCLRLLIENGADVNKANQFGYTPTFIAANKGHADCTSLLKAAGGR